jgi:hypothetical protein
LRVRVTHGGRHRLSAGVGPALDAFQAADRARLEPSRSSNHGVLDGLLVGRFEAALRIDPTRERDRDPLLEPFEDPRIEVRGPAHSGGVAELIGDVRHDARDGSTARRPAARRIGTREQDRGEHGRVPGPEILRRELLTGELLHALVDVGGSDVTPPAPLVVCEELGSSAPSSQERAEELPEVRVADRDEPSRAALRAETERGLVPSKADS